MLMPKRVKYRREHRGKMRGEAKGGKEILEQIRMELNP